MNKRADALAETGIEFAKQEITNKEKSKKAVYMYVAVLFLIVILFTLLSYFIQQRNNSQLYTLNEKNATAQQNIENLQEMNLQLNTENDALQAKLSGLEAEIDDLERQLGVITQQWQDEVQLVRETDAVKYNELLAKYNELIEKNEFKGN